LCSYLHLYITMHGFMNVKLGVSLRFASFCSDIVSMKEGKLQIHHLLYTWCVRCK
jgi:hypothetical protein